MFLFLLMDMIQIYTSDFIMNLISTWTKMLDFEIIVVYA